LINKIVNCKIENITPECVGEVELLMN
jgi:hypothetical protein